MPTYVVRGKTPDRTDSGPYPKAMTSYDAYSTGPALIAGVFTTAANIALRQAIWETGGAAIGSILVVDGGNFQLLAGNTATVQISTAAIASTQYAFVISFQPSAGGGITQLYLRQGNDADDVELADLVGSGAIAGNTDWSGSNQAGIGQAGGGSYLGAFPNNFLGTIDSDIELFVALPSEPGGAVALIVAQLRQRSMGGL